MCRDATEPGEAGHDGSMTLISRASYLLCSAFLVLPGCVSSQLLGDPEATDGGSGGAETAGSTTGGEATSTASGSTEGGSNTTVDPTAQTSSTTAPDPETESSTDGSGELCSDWTPPPFDCPEQGESRAGLVAAAFDGFEFAESLPCEVIALASDDIDRWQVRLQCEDTVIEFDYVSAAPYIDPPVGIGTQVLYTGVEFEESPNFEPSVALHSPDGDLILAYVDHFSLQQPLPIDLAPLEFEFAATGCPAFGTDEAFCEDGESIVAARVSVVIDAEQPLEIADGNSGTVTVEGTTYRVTVGEASRIVCWDESCAGDESGPTDRLRMLVVALP